MGRPAKAVSAPERPRSSAERTGRSASSLLGKSRAPGGTAARGRAAGGARPTAHTELIKAFSEQLAQYDPTGAIVSRSDDVTAMARDAAQRVLDTASSWVEHLGSFYDSEGVAKLLSRTGTPISRQAVHKRRGLLALTTGSGQVVYPAFQFDGRRLVPGLAAVLDSLPETLVSRWTVASWLVSPEAELEGARPIDVLRDHGSGGHAAVQAAAQRWSAQLAA